MEPGRKCARTWSRRIAVNTRDEAQPAAWRLGVSARRRRIRTSKTGFLDCGRDDRHQFRFIVSAEEGVELPDLRENIRA